jgi:uncharacterized membrane protein YbhN (UPF0104 family)
MSLSPDEKPANGTRRALSIALSLAVTAGFGFIAWYYIDWNAFFAAYTRISLTQLVGLCALGLVTVLLRVARLCVAIGQPLQWIYFRAVTLQGAAVATLPAKIGEAVLPLALVRQAGYSLARAVGVLLLLRLYDLLTLMVFGAVSLALLAADFGMAAWRPVLLAGAAGAVGVMMMFPQLAILVSRLFHKYLKPEGKIVRLIDQLSFSSRDLSPPRLFGLILVSGLIWACLFLVFYLTGVITGATPGPSASVLAGTAGSLAFALPVNGLANLGPFEAAWASIMIPLGVAPASAVAAAILSHFILIFCNLALAGVGVAHWGVVSPSSKLI